MSVERVGWAEFLASVFVWRQGEHVSIIGPTGTGKSYLGRALLPARDYVISLGTKREDETLRDYVRHDGFTRIGSWPPRAPWWQKRAPGWDDRVLLWPPYRGGVEAVRERMRVEFSAALDDVLRFGRWCVDVDEVYYLCKILGLTSYLEEIWTQGRSSRISLLGKTQRPAWVPLFMYDQASHLFLFSDNDETNLRRVAGLGGLSAAVVRDTVASLPHHDVLYVNTRRRLLVHTRVE